jgi:hypothetical protein
MVFFKGPSGCGVKKHRGKNRGFAVFPLLVYQLFFFPGDNRFHRTLIAAGAAVSAKFRVYDVFIVAFRYGFYRTFIFA